MKFIFKQIIDRKKTSLKSSHLLPPLPFFYIDILSQSVDLLLCINVYIMFDEYHNNNNNMRMGNGQLHFMAVYCCTNCRFKLCANVSDDPFRTSFSFIRI